MARLGARVGVVVAFVTLFSCSAEEGSGGVATGGGGSSGTTGTTGGASGSGGSPEAGGDSVAGAAGAPDGAVGDAAAPELPSELLDLANWKITLPVEKPGTSGLWEVLQPELATFSIDPWFRLNAAKDGLLFRAHAGGVTTSNSGYPRSELREMTDQGVNKASWSTTSGTHTMTIKQAILHLPEVKPHVVAGQIHDATDDLVMIRLEGAQLFVEGGGQELGTLDSAYSLGKVFTVKIEASGGKVRVFHDDMVTPAIEVSRAASGCYFKAGVYTQSSTSTGDKPDAYGEVVIFDLAVTHQ